MREALDLWFCYGSGAGIGQLFVQADPLIMASAGNP